MAVHSWRRRPSKHFGDVWVPFALIEIQRTDGRFQPLGLQIDSGAVISLLGRSFADVLGVELEVGRRIEMTSIGGGQMDAYVHELPTRFDDQIVLNVPFAIATTDSVPNLLGRLGVFDNLQLDFDSTLEETRVTAPWLDDAERRFWKKILEIERHILDRWNDLELPPPAHLAAKRMITRAAQVYAAGAGLAKLHRAFAGPLIIRSMFELALQFEYLMKDRIPRAQKYLDFAKVTRHRYAMALVENPVGPSARDFASSPLRQKGEARNKAEFDRVAKQFRRPNGGYWSNWYCMQIKQLAEELEWDGEYRYWYARCSAWAHGDPFETQRDSSFPGNDNPVVMMMCRHYYALMLLRVADKLILTEEHYEFLKAAAQDIS